MCLCLCPYTHLVLFDHMGHQLSAACLQAFIGQRLKAHLITVEDCCLEENTGKTGCFCIFIHFLFYESVMWHGGYFLTSHGHKFKYWTYNLMFWGHKWRISWQQMNVPWLKRHQRHDHGLCSLSSKLVLGKVILISYLWKRSVHIKNWIINTCNSSMS